MAGSKILIVEDDEGQRFIMDRILKSIDPEITHQWVTSAEDAVFELQREHFDLVLADYSLEGKCSGLDLYDFCLERFPEMPFMMISSLEMTLFFKLVGQHRSGPAYLPKPFSPGECGAIIENLLDRVS